jgi:hypothetical protein
VPRFASGSLDLLERGRGGRGVRDEHVEQAGARRPHDRPRLRGARGHAEHGARGAELGAGHPEQELLLLELHRLAVDVEVARDDVAGRVLEFGARGHDVRRAGLHLERRRPDADERGREPVPQRQPAAHLRVRQQRPAQVRGRQGRRVQEAHVGAAGVGDPAGDLVGLEPLVGLVEARDGRNEADAAQRREPARLGELPDRRAPGDGQHVAGAQAEPRELGERGRDQDLQLVPGRGGDDDRAPNAERRLELLRELRSGGRPPDLDVDDALIARDAQHPRDGGARHPQAVGDLLLGELILVVELGCGEDGGRCVVETLGRVFGEFVRHSFP